jgi:hypothetical protein
MPAISRLECLCAIAIKRFYGCGKTLAAALSYFGSSAARQAHLK